MAEEKPIYPTTPATPATPTKTGDPKQDKPMTPPAKQPETGAPIKSVYPQAKAN
jgi:hypothetical protein